VGDGGLVHHDDGGGYDYVDLNHCHHLKNRLHLPLA
jgi:hypothetical protein